MKKKLAAGVLSLVLLVGGATAAYGAIDPNTLSEFKALTQQVFSLQKQMVDKQQEAGLITPEKADVMKKFMEQRQQSSDQAFAEGKVLIPGMGGMGKGMRGDVKAFNAEPMTDEQITAWSEAAQARLDAQVESMTSEAKLTPAQIEKWRIAAQAQLDLQKELMSEGTFVPGVMGRGMRGGHGGNFGGFGNNIAPTAPTAPTATPTTNLQ